MTGAWETLDIPKLLPTFGDIGHHLSTFLRLLIHAISTFKVSWCINWYDTTHYRVSREPMSNLSFIGFRRNRNIIPFQPQKEKHNLENRSNLFNIYNFMQKYIYNSIHVYQTFFTLLWSRHLAHLARRLNEMSPDLIWFIYSSSSEKVKRWEAIKRKFRWRRRKVKRINETFN